MVFFISDCQEAAPIHLRSLHPSPVLADARELPRDDLGDRQRPRAQDPVRDGEAHPFPRHGLRSSAARPFSRHEIRHLRRSAFRRAERGRKCFFLFCFHYEVKEAT